MRVGFPQGGKKAPLEEVRCPAEIEAVQHAITITHLDSEVLHQVPLHSRTDAPHFSTGQVAAVQIDVGIVKRECTSNSEILSPGHDSATIAGMVNSKNGTNGVVKIFVFDLISYCGRWTADEKLVQVQEVSHFRLRCNRLYKRSRQIQLNDWGCEVWSVFQR